MHKLLFTFFCLSIFLSKSQTETVLNNMLEQEQAWNKGDIKKFMQHYWQNDSLTFIGSKGVTRGWQKTLDNYIKSYPTKESMGQLTFTIIETTALSTESVYVIGKWELKKEKPASGHFTLLWRKVNNAWVIVSDHTS